MQIFCVYFVIASNGLKCIMIITSIMIMWTPMYVYLHKQFLLESLHRALCSDQTQTARVYQNADSSPNKHED